MRIFLIILILICSPSFAGMQETLEQGDQTAAEFLKGYESQVQIIQKGGEDSMPPHYQGVSKEAGLNPSELSKEASAFSSKDSVAGFIREVSTAKKFALDAQHDPLIRTSSEIQNKPLEHIGGEEMKIVKVSHKEGKGEILTCEESGELGEQSCQAWLKVTVKEELGPKQEGVLNVPGSTLFWSHRPSILNSATRPKKKHFIWSVGVSEEKLKKFISVQNSIPIEQILSAKVNSSGGWIHMQKKDYTYNTFVFTYRYQPKIKVVKTEWVDDCSALEKRADQGLCHYHIEKCLEGPEARIISGVSVTKPCWKKRRTYLCRYPAANNCEPLKIKGCTQINSACQKHVGKVCVIYNQTYSCPSSKQTTSQEIITGGKPLFCLDGQCRDQTWEDNNEAGASLAQLTVLKELQKQNTLETLFKGSDERCKKETVGFKDCCKVKGWGVSIGLTSCSESEDLLSHKRSQGKCHLIGTYCDKKIMGKCVAKKTTFCCFGSKLLRVLHEQGRGQLGRNWGGAKNPNCQGFSVQELQKIDFSKLNLSEVFGDLLSNYKPPQVKAINEKLQRRLKEIQAKVKSDSPKTPLKQKETRI